MNHTPNAWSLLSPSVRQLMFTVSPTYASGALILSSVKFTWPATIQHHKDSIKYSTGTVYSLIRYRYRYSQLSLRHDLSHDEMVRVICIGRELTRSLGRSTHQYEYKPLKQTAR